MPDLIATQFGQLTQDGFQSTTDGASATCGNKAFYVAGITATKRKTGIRAQGEKILKSMAVPCTGTLATKMEVVFKGSSAYWPELFNKRFLLPISPYLTTTYKVPNSSPVVNATVKFYNPFLTTCKYFDPNRKFMFSLGEVNLALPKEFFNFTYVDTSVSPSSTKYIPMMVTSYNEGYLGTVGKKTSATFYFKSFEWNSGISYCYQSLDYARNSYSNYAYFSNSAATANTQANFNNNFKGIRQNPTFLASDYCYEVSNGSLYFKRMTLVPADPELSDILGIESISCRLTDAL